MASQEQATRIDLFSFKSAPMRAFHMSWLAFFTCFVAWFGVAPLMPLLREEFQLSGAQVGRTMIASVAGTIFARLLIGPLCDKYGPRRMYTWLLALGALPVAGVALAWNYESLLVFRLAIGMVGASFVVTQYHTSQMFAANTVGTANATAAGWGNAGGGVAQVLMPFTVSTLLLLGLDKSSGWRVAMLVPAGLMLLLAFFYYRLTQDTPSGNFDATRARKTAANKSGSFKAAAADTRVWVLALAYGACFGIELTANNIAALYFHDRFSLGLTAAGVLAALHGLTNVFARSLGGYIGDKLGVRFGLAARGWLLGGLLLAEGLALFAFSAADRLPYAVLSLVLFGLFVAMSCGATYSVVPFVNRSAMGSVSGIVGAGGNLGAVLSATLLGAGVVSTEGGFFYMAVAVCIAGVVTLLVRFQRDVAPAALPARAEPEPAVLPAE